MRKLCTPTGINRRRDHDVPGQVAFAPALLSLEHLAEIHVSENSVTLIARILAKVMMSSASDLFPQRG